MASDPEHTEVTRRNGYRYIFTGKHHGGGSPSDARWRESISRDEEFAVFDNADWHEIGDEDGWLYCVWQVDAELSDLGTWGQQVAEFPSTKEGVPWHGYPIWAVNHEAPENRKGEKMRPAKQVFVKLERAGLITARQRKRLWKGDHA
jgi:hypothetical protein